MRAHIDEWLRRYLPAEVASLVGALVAAGVGWSLTGNYALVAVAGAWGETTLYYAVMFVREVRATRSVKQTLRNLLLEFGVAEGLDTALIRPALMYLGLQLSSDIAIGTLLGKAAADVVFYAPTIAAYELRKKYVSGLRGV